MDHCHFANVKQLYKNNGKKPVLKPKQCSHIYEYTLTSIDRIEVKALISECDGYKRIKMLTKRNSFNLISLSPLRISEVSKPDDRFRLKNI